jgi:transcriptional regulator with XRE-family HTH domain
MATPSLDAFFPGWIAAAGMTRAQLAVAVGVDGSQVTRWCQGARPDGQHLPAICRALALTRAQAILLYEASGVALAPELGIES